MKKNECYIFILIGYVFGLKEYDFVGNHTVSFWKKRLNFLK